ncbi:DUF171-domain-containing protein [Sporormia fimetaria CBS 119925]|uniref:DUF171-domain-containing protein n=1 Tax=Sporormia fimetaria CBS 119925 TaxID=1340428 RepID=A0A6A6VNU6_9PLEO|nr:DUF171-domain-containing protein [Sporormia fimetaria CBS 119925]
MAKGSKEKTSKKRKVRADDEQENTEADIYSADAIIDAVSTPKTARSLKRSRHDEPELDTSKPSAVFKPKKGRDWTLSIALPGSFIANTKVIDQKYELAARIARAAAVFCVDEVVIFDDAPTTIPPHGRRKGKSQTKAEILSQVRPDAEPWENPDQFLYHLLSFLECPGHLRHHLFEEHPNLKGVGKLPTLDMPHHMRSDEWSQYREGATLEPAPGTNSADSTLVECGLPYPVTLPYSIPPGTRVTLKFASSEPPPSWPNLSEYEIDNLEVEATAPSAPREEAGYYWGYNVRKVDNFSAVYTDSPFLPDGYDCTIGTSERGVALSSIMPDAHTATTRQKHAATEKTGKLPDEFKHLLLVIGGVTGLEPAVASDPELQKMGMTKETAHEAFDHWVNLVPGQGSRTIRTEEAVWLALMGTRDYVYARM